MGMRGTGVADLLRFACKLDKRATPAFGHKHTTTPGIDIDGGKRRIGADLRLARADSTSRSSGLHYGRRFGCLTAETTILETGTISPSI